MIATAKAFQWLGAVAGVLGVLGGLLLVIAWLYDFSIRNKGTSWRELIRSIWPSLKNRAMRRPNYQPEEHTGRYTTPLAAIQEANRAAAAQNASTHETTLNHSAEFHQ